MILMHFLNFNFFTRSENKPLYSALLECLFLINEDSLSIHAEDKNLQIRQECFKSCKKKIKNQSIK